MMVAAPTLLAGLEPEQTARSFDLDRYRSATDWSPRHGGCC